LEDDDFTVLGSLTFFEAARLRFLGAGGGVGSRSGEGDGEAASGLGEGGAEETWDSSTLETGEGGAEDSVSDMGDLGVSNNADFRKWTYE